jgi:hypothetical protein
MRRSDSIAPSSFSRRIITLTFRLATPISPCPVKDAFESGRLEAALYGSQDGCRYGGTVKLRPTAEQGQLDGCRFPRQDHEHENASLLHRL